MTTNAHERDTFHLIHVVPAVEFDMIGTSSFMQSCSQFEIFSLFLRARGKKEMNTPVRANS
jgi:hypothetical protein